jgi:Uma2 family endonuclease
MGMPETLAEWTAEAIRTLPDDGRRYEAVDGALLVTPAPSYPHQYAVAALYDRLAPYVRRHAIGAVALAPANVELGPRTLVQPDLFVARLVEGRRPRDSAEVGIPLLAVEVLSPSTARADRHIKRRRYQRAGISEYWIVDLDARLVERWRPGDERPEIAAERLTWQASAEVTALEIDLPELFAEAAG